MGNNVFLSSSGSGFSCNVWLDMNNNIVTNLPAPVNPSDGVNKAYVDTSISSNLTASFIKVTPIPGLKATNVQDALSELNKDMDDCLPLSGGTMTGLINMNNNSITNLLTPTEAQTANAANVQYVNTYIDGHVTSIIQPAITKIQKDITTTTDSITSLENSLKEYLPLAGGTMTGNLQMDNHTVTGLTTPTDTELTNAANVQYVNNALSGVHLSPFYQAIQLKPPVISNADSSWINLNGEGNEFFSSSNSSEFFSFDSSYIKWYLLQTGLYLLNYSIVSAPTQYAYTICLYLNDAVTKSKQILTYLNYTAWSGGYASAIIPITSISQTNQFYLTISAVQAEYVGSDFLSTNLTLIWLPTK